MKKLIALLLSSALLLTGCGGSGTSNETTDTEKVTGFEGQTLKFYNWGEYIGENVISNFEEKYGVTVLNELFDSNEMMYTKIQAGDKYDVLVPSDYMIERLIKEDLLQPIDKSKITNIDNLADGVKNLDYDPDNTYSVPYFWGSVGLVYNKNNVPTEVIEKEGYNILKNTNYKGNIYIYDSERDAFMTAFQALGYSMNTESDAEIEAA
ncbi:MAG: PotD/PotF family extracellular solute-binding protein, partial [Lachnospirales bacterium]